MSQSREQLFCPHCGARLKGTRPKQPTCPYCQEEIEKPETDPKLKPASGDPRQKLRSGIGRRKQRPM